MRMGRSQDPAPSGFAQTHGGAQGEELPRMSRTMQYADSYAAARASVVRHLL